MSDITVVGAGLAGCEAAWQCAQRGLSVTLCDMKPERRSCAHHSDLFSELVCSNSLRGAALSTAPGLLKEELRRLGSLIIDCADKTAVPAGGALAVDREAFSSMVTERIRSHPNINLICELLEDIPEGRAIIATGPLTEGGLADKISSEFGELWFYDAAAPIVSADSVDMEHAFFASRYGKGDGSDYLNCPMTKEEYIAFREALCSAREAEVHGFEDGRVFEGCMPVEVMARRGEDTLRFGPLKPVGLRDPETGRDHYAVLQLRKENAAGDMFNLVGCQTHLLFPEQKRVFSMIPALRDAEFLRYGVMHRNSYIRSPGRLDKYFRVIKRPELMFAGQITGVEGYIESISSGLCAGVNAAREFLGCAPVDFPPETASGALAGYISNPSITDFQPMNINFGLLPPLDVVIKNKREKNERLSRRALDALSAVIPTVKEFLI